MAIAAPMICFLILINDERSDKGLLEKLGLEIMGCLNSGEST
jgi:hypothetical protein